MGTKTETVSNSVSTSNGVSIQVPAYSGVLGLTVAKEYEYIGQRVAAEYTIKCGGSTQKKSGYVDVQSHTFLDISSATLEETKVSKEKCGATQLQCIHSIDTSSVITSSSAVESRFKDCFTSGARKAGWTFFSRTGMCYKYITAKKTPVDALNYCKQLANKGSLVSIHNKETISFILSISNQQKTWIGAYRVVDGQNKWAWYDGTPWDYTSWNSGEPNDFGSKEDFVGMYAHAQYAGKWNDNAGIHQYTFVCQAPRTLGRALNKSAEDLFEESAEVYQEYDVKQRDLLEQQNYTSAFERELEGEQAIEMIDSPIVTLDRSENEVVDEEMKDEDEEVKDEDDEEGEMKDEEDQMEDEHEYLYEEEYEDGDEENVSLMI